MNISYKWLKEYVDFDMTPQEVADALTSCGLEVSAHAIRGYVYMTLRSLITNDVKL